MNINNILLTVDLRKKYEPPLTIQQSFPINIA